MTLRALLQRFFSTVVLFSVVGIVSCAGGGSASGSGASGGALAITTTQLELGIFQTAYSDTVKASGGSTPYTFALTGGSLPSGVTLNASTGVVAGTPQQYGQSTLSFKVTDSAGATATGSAVYTVAYPLYLNTTTNSFYVEQGVSVAPTVLLPTTGGTAPYTARIVSGSLPAGLVIDGRGVMTGTATTPGSSSAVVNLTDSKNISALTATVNFQVFSALTVRPATIREGSIGQFYTASLYETSSGGYPPLTWTVTSGSLPPGVTLNTSGNLNGTPTTLGDFPFTATVRDYLGGGGTFSYILHIGTSLVFPAANLPDANVGEPYSAKVTATGGTPPYTYSATTYSGLNVSADGSISGQTTTENVVYLDISVTDAGRRSTSTSFTIRSYRPFAILPEALPDAVIGAPYYAAFLPSRATFTSFQTLPFSLTAGSLSTGITGPADGLLRGTPSVASASSFSISAVNPFGSKGSRDYTLKVASRLSAGASDAKLNGSYAFQFLGRTNNPGNSSGAVFGKAMVGQLIFDGLGNVTGSFDSNSAASGYSSGNTLTGSYRLENDGTGTIVYTSAGKVNTLAISASNLSGAVYRTIHLIQFDNVDKASPAGTYGSGTARLQSAVTQSSLSGNYVAAMTGESASVAGGAASGQFGNMASIAFLPLDGTTATQTGASQDVVFYGSSQLAVSQTVAATLTDVPSGRGTITLTPTGTSYSGAPANYVFYAVAPAEIYLMSTDSHSTTFDLLAGNARKQVQTAYTPASALTGPIISYSAGTTGGGVAGAGTTVAASTTTGNVRRLVFSAGTTYTSTGYSTAGGVLSYSAPANGTVQSSSADGRFTVRLGSGATSDTVLRMIDNNVAVGLQLRGSPETPLGLVYFEPQAPTTQAVLGRYATHALPTAAASGSLIGTATVTGTDYSELQQTDRIVTGGSGDDRTTLSYLNGRSVDSTRFDIDSGTIVFFEASVGQFTGFAINSDKLVRVVIDRYNGQQRYNVFPDTTRLQLEIYEK